MSTPGWWTMMEAVGNGALAIARKHEVKRATPGAPAPKAQRSVAPGSKIQRLLNAVSKPGGATMAEICEASGFDERNAKTTINILKSRKGIAIKLVDGRYHA